MDATGDFVPTVRHLPRQIGIELVRGFNFSCQMCPVTTNAPRETDHFQFIELGLLEKLLPRQPRSAQILTADSVQQQPIAAPEGSEINHGIHRNTRKRESESTSPFRVLPGGNSRP